jgi:putative membrane protein
MVLREAGAGCAAAPARAAPGTGSPPVLLPSERGSIAGILRAMKIIVRWLLLAAALLLVAHLYPGVTVKSFGSAMIAAFVIGLFNTLLRPLLVLLTLPVTLLTLGLFLFVINALMFWAAAQVLDGFGVASFAAALIGSLIYSLCSMVIDVAMERLFTKSAA